MKGIDPKQPHPPVERLLAPEDPLARAVSAVLTTVGLLGVAVFCAGVALDLAVDSCVGRVLTDVGWLTAIASAMLVRAPRVVVFCLLLLGSLAVALFALAPLSDSAKPWCSAPVVTFIASLAATGALVWLALRAFARSDAEQDGSAERTTQGPGDHDDGVRT